MDYPVDGGRARGRPLRRASSRRAEALAHPTTPNQTKDDMSRTCTTPSASAVTRTRTRSRRPTAASRPDHPDVNPDPPTQDRFELITLAYEVLLRPAEAAACTTWAATPSAAAAASARAPGSATSWTPSSARCHSARRGPRPAQHAALAGRADPARGATSAEAAFGTSPRAQVDTAVVCGDLHGSGARRAPSRAWRPAAGAARCSRSRAPSSAQVMTSRPCPACHGLGTVIPDPCRECSGDGRVRPGAP